MALLEVKGLTKLFGGLAAVNNLNLTVEKGECLGLIGPNGAGKTTCFNLISGFLPPTRGKVFFKGEDVTGLKPHEVAKRGLVRTFQLTTLFLNVTVLKNVVVAFHRHSQVGFFGAVLQMPRARKREQQLHERAREILDFMGLDALRDEMAINLPHGHQRALGIAIALATEPELLMLDEPVTGMTPEETLHMMGLLGKILDSGITLILVEHNMRAVMGQCNRIVVISFGTQIAEGTPEQIQSNPEVIRAYLGEAEDVA